MFNAIKRLVGLAAVITVMSAPSVAYARLELNPTPPASSGAAPSTNQPSAARPSASASQGFRWGDAGIGAVGMLALVGAAGATSLVARRHAHGGPAS